MTIIIMVKRMFGMLEMVMHGGNNAVFLLYLSRMHGDALSNSTLYMYTTFKWNKIKENNKNKRKERIEWKRLVFYFRVDIQKGLK